MEGEGGAVVRHVRVLDYSIITVYLKLASND